jgi:hypothetical protein
MSVRIDRFKEESLPSGRAMSQDLFTNILEYVKAYGMKASFDDHPLGPVSFQFHGTLYSRNGLKESDRCIFKLNRVQSHVQGHPQKVSLQFAGWRVAEHSREQF